MVPPGTLRRSMFGTYHKIEDWADVPPAGPLDAKIREGHRLDFKETASPEKTAEHAKDMATFANTFGGVILVGTKVDQGIVTHPGISRAHAARMAEVYEQTAKDMCAPVPVVNAIIIAMPASTNVLLAINVDPVVEGPVGAKVKDQDAWLFPVREASHTKYLKPNELPMYMNPKLRRVLLLLDYIKENDRIQLWTSPSIRTPASQGQPTSERRAAVRAKMDLSRNWVGFFIATGEDSPVDKLLNLPLTEVEDIWEDQHGVWNLRVTGRIGYVKQGVTYQPLVR